MHDSLRVLHSALQNYHENGPPSITDMYPCYGTKQIDTNIIKSEYEAEIPEPNIEEEIAEEDPEIDVSVGDLPCVCHTCYHAFISDEDKLRDLKYWLKQLEGGITQEYRCPSCRECPCTGIAPVR